MKKRSTIFLQVVVVLIGVGVLVLMLWEPHLEGRNAHATPFQIYFNDPFLAYAYIASIAFFMALYQTFKLLGYVAQDTIFSLSSVIAFTEDKILRDISCRFHIRGRSLLLYCYAWQG